jgi:hypothetical protein
MPPMTKGGVLTLDLAGVVGWAYGPLAAVQPLFGHWPRPKFGGEGAFYAAFDNTLAAKVEECRPSEIVLEAALALPGQTDMRSCRQQLTLRGFCYAEGYRSKTPVSEIDAYTARLEVLGTGRFPRGEAKREVVAHCRARGIGVSDHNEADAVVLWIWHKQRMTGGLPIAGPLWRREIEHRERAPPT